jgi:putative hydrolases of HD superfamily
MEIKAENPAGLLQEKEAAPIIRAYFELCHLKQLFRQGWLRRGIPRERCESVAEHSFGVAVLALWLSQAYYPQRCSGPSLDQNKVLRMALLHDCGEIYAGDIVPSDAVSAEEKHAWELDAVRQVFNKLPDGESYVQVWLEFEAGESPEAQFIRQLDRLEMGLQASVYTAQGFEGLEQFFTSARQALVDEKLIELLDEASLINRK